MQQNDEVVFIRPEDVQVLIDVLAEDGWTLEGTHIRTTRRFWRWSLPDGREAELKVTGIMVGPGSDLMYSGGPETDQLYRVPKACGDAWLVWRAEDHDPEDLYADMQPIHDLLVNQW